MGKNRIPVFLVVLAMFLSACSAFSDSAITEDQFCTAVERTRIDFSVLNDVRDALEQHSVFQEAARDSEAALNHTLESLFIWLGVMPENIPEWARDIVAEEIERSEGDPDFAVMNVIYDRLVEDPQYSDLRDPGRLEELLEVLIEGTIDALNDPFADYVPADLWTGGFTDQHLSGSFVGLGVTLGTNERGEISVNSVMSSTPAEEAGLQAGDALLAVNGLSTENCTNRQFSLQLRALENPKVEFSVARERRDSLERDMLDITVVREEIKLVDIATYPGVDLPDGRGNTSEGLPYNCGSSRTLGEPCPFNDEDGNPEILYIKLDTFSRQMYFDLEYFLKNIDQSKFKGVVLDLRDNGGGWPVHCVNPSDGRTCIWSPDLFMSTTEPIRMTKDASGVITRTRGTPGRNWLRDDIPMTILMNRNSASASEGLAGALRDNGRAIIVNADPSSHGKGMSSRYLPLRQGTYGAVKVSVNFFLTPNGDIIEKMDTTGDGRYDVGGLEPDIYVPWSDQDYREHGRDVNFDPTLNAALEWLEEQLSR